MSPFDPTETLIHLHADTPRARVRIGRAARKLKGGGSEMRDWPRNSDI